jgi:proton-translocating NADH-quinone oxidoreductase chain L
MSWQVGLYAAAVLTPLAAFTVELIFIRQLRRLNAYIATGAIAFSCLLSLIGFITYFSQAHGAFSLPHHEAPAETGPATQYHDEPVEHAEKHHVLAWKGSFNWVTLNNTRDGTNPNAFSIPIGIYVDNLTAIMFLMVTFIATLIHIYSMGYMHDDPRYPRFFTYLSLFCFSMLGLVASANVFMIFVFWELVGVCSYLLIGFWYEEKKNADAANKAFIVNRVGDIGMLVGLGVIWSTLGTFNIADINRGLRNADGQLNVTQTYDGQTNVVVMRDPAGESEDERLPAGLTGKQITYSLLIVAGLGIFAGCMGKSAQFPLHVWLPDAMAGPTPVSALIHAATMVAAGVYLVGRFYPLFTPEVSVFIGYIGGITLFIAATIAMVQTDYKKVLAYSTVSQLGFMMLALGVGGWAAGLFHLLTHAFFKALLFLGAGSVYHAVHTYEMPVLGGLWRKMKITGWTMLLATFAISGFPFFSGFYSKDAILSAAIVFVAHHPRHILLFLLPSVGAAITAFYMVRMWLLIFAGTPRGYPAHDHADHGHGAHGHDDHHHSGNPYDHAHESPAIMVVPLMLLAVPTVIIGYPLSLIPLGGVGVHAAATTPILELMLVYGEPNVRLVTGEFMTVERSHMLAFGASLLIVLAGIGSGFAYYLTEVIHIPWRGREIAWNPPRAMRRRFEPGHTVQRFSGIYNFLVHKWYFDELYDFLFVRRTLELARICSELDKRLIDGLVNGSARATALLSKLEGVFDNIAVDGLVNLTAKVVYLVGDRSRALQTGRLRNYLMFLACALVGLFVGVYAWIQR